MGRAGRRRLPTQSSGHKIRCLCALLCAQMGDWQRRTLSRGRRAGPDFSSRPGIFATIGDGTGRVAPTGSRTAGIRDARRPSPGVPTLRRARTPAIQTSNRVCASLSTRAHFGLHLVRPRTLGPLIRTHHATKWGTGFAPSPDSRGDALLAAPERPRTCYPSELAP